MTCIALATAIAAIELDEDMAPLLQALAQIDVQVEIRAWDDPTVSWSRYDAVVLRSTWNYAEQLDRFLAWCKDVHGRSRLLNPFEVVRWNTNKLYLADLQAGGIEIVPSHFLSPGSDPNTLPKQDEFVVKPCVGAGSRDARRFRASERAAAIKHAASLLDTGRDVLVQPYLDQVDQAGETALLYFDGAFSHAIRKGALLPRGGTATRALFAAEHIQPRIPSEAELALAERALAAVPYGRLAYARVDLLPSLDGPRLLELELSEPSLFLAHGAGSADRFARALARYAARETIASR